MLHRRAALGGLAAFAAMPRSAAGAGVIDLGWQDLLPEGDIAPATLLGGFIDHENGPTYSEQPPSSGVRTDWNGKTVRIPGFMVPIDHRGTGVVAFILVPYVGACVHVPPPPANQLVFVTVDTPYETDGMFEAIHVVGKLQVSTVSTHLAEVGYTLTASDVRPFPT